MKSSDYCPCGGIILLDTEEWTVPLCMRCADTPIEIIEKLEKTKEENKHLKEEIQDGNYWIRKQKEEIKQLQEKNKLLSTRPPRVKWDSIERYKLMQKELIDNKRLRDSLSGLLKASNDNACADSDDIEETVEALTKAERIARKVLETK